MFDGRGIVGELIALRHAAPTGLFVDILKRQKDIQDREKIQKKKLTFIELTRLFMRYVFSKLCVLGISYITLGILVEASSLCINSDCRRGECTLDVGGIVMTVVELREQRRRSEF